MHNLIDEYTTIREIVWKGFCLLFAFNYFAFRTELSEEEYEQNHPNIDPFSRQVALSNPTETWETFDKDNAPKAFIVLPPKKNITILLLSAPAPAVCADVEVTEPVRDKSPPAIPII